MTTHVLYTDPHGDKLTLKPSESGVFTLTTTIRLATPDDSRSFLTLTKDDVPALLRAFAKAADVDVLIIDKPAATTTPLSVDRPPTDNKVQLTHGFNFAVRLTRDEAIQLIWKIAHVLVDIRTEPSRAEVGTLLNDLVTAGFTIPHPSSDKARELLKKGYRKDPAQAAPTGKPAHIFNDLAEAKAQTP